MTFAMGAKIGESIIKNKEIIKKIKKGIELIEKSKFSCLKYMKPNSVSIVNKKSFENDKENQKLKKELIESKMNNSSKSDKKSLLFNSSIFGINDVKITKEEEENVSNELECILEKNENDLLEEMNIINKIYKSHKQFENELDLALKDSIFEFYKIGLVIVKNDYLNNEFQNNKLNYQNCVTKYLFHGTRIDFSSKILQTNFKVGRDHWYGLGIYFTDQIDYARYYWNGWDTPNSCINKISRVDEKFSILISEIFYDKNKFKHIHDYSLKIVLKDSPNEEDIFTKYKDKIVRKYGIHYVEVSWETTKEISQDKKYNTKIFKGKEYVITNKEQILPLCAITLKRVEYCIIWHDPNFAGGKYQKELLERKKYAMQMTNYNIYYEVTEESALKLIQKKKYNKIILISNCGNNFAGRNFVDKARKILEFNIMVLFFGNWIGHLNWIKNYPNSLFINTDNFFRY